MLALVLGAAYAAVLPCEPLTLTVAGLLGDPLDSPRQYVLLGGNAQVSAEKVEGALSVSGVMAACSPAHTS